MLQQVYCNNLKTVILYGSFTRGTATSESDIDIMVLVDGNNQDLYLFEDKLSDISTDICIKYSKVLSIIDIGYQEYVRWVRVLQFHRNVSEEGEVLYTAQCEIFYKKDNMLD